MEFDREPERRSVTVTHSDGEVEIRTEWRLDALRGGVIEEYDARLLREFAGPADAWLLLSRYQQSEFGSEMVLVVSYYKAHAVPYPKKSPELPPGNLLVGDGTIDVDALMFGLKEFSAFSARAEELDEVMTRECRHALSLLPRWPRCIPCDVPLEVAHYGVSGSFGTGVWSKCPKGCLVELNRTCSFTPFTLSPRAARLMAGSDTWTAPRFRRH